MRIIISSCLVLFIVLGCVDDSKERAKKTKIIPSAVFMPIEKPAFNVDSAYVYIVKQVAFGPRVPGTNAHLKAVEYFEKQFLKWNWQTTVQLGKSTTFNGKKIAIKNIIARSDTINKNRILLMAHWDSRPFADRDEMRKTEAIDGANDGASGVGVLMEIARAISSSDIQPKVGIDIILFDAEDYGQPSGMMVDQAGDTWCLGSQYWAKNLSDNYIRPKYGILLDMVGAKDAVFPKEGVSMQYNPQLVNKVWYLASKLGYGKYFIQEEAKGGITDDHLYVNRIANIPSIDIIHYDPYQGDFGSFHHRHLDDIDIIDKSTLKVVGQVIMETIYREK